MVNNFIGNICWKKALLASDVQITTFTLYWSSITFSGICQCPLFRKDLNSL